MSKTKSKSRRALRLIHCRSLPEREANFFISPGLKSAQTTVDSVLVPSSMKASLPRPQVIVAVGWLATAAIAFCVGRLTIPAETSSAAGGASSDAANRKGKNGSGASQDAEAAQAGSRGSQFALGEDGTPLTLEKLTNGQPLEKWVKHLMAEEDSLVRMTGFMRLLGVLKDPADLKAALEAINLRADRGFSRSSRFTEYGMLLEKWTQLDPKGAIEFAEGRSREEKYIASSTVLRTWTRTDPAAAIAWAQAKGKETAGAEDQGGGPGGPGGWGGQSSALSTVLTQLARADLDRALTVASTETFDRRSRTLDTLASELVSQRTLDGARKAIDAMPAGSLRDGLISQLASQFAAKDAPGTADWVLGLPASDAKSRALAETIAEWAKKDATAAGGFLAKLPATAEADRSRESYANAVVKKDPLGAIAWATAITDEERQRRAVESVARTWIKEDATTATAWVAESTLPDDLKKRIETPRPTGGPGGFNGRGRGPGN